MRYTLLAGLLVMTMATVSLAGVDKGTLETGFGGRIHLSPEPTEFHANFHVLYYMSQVLGIGPYIRLDKIGEFETDSITYKPATYYGIGAMAKMYLPMVMADGKMTPFVAAAFGMKSVLKELEMDTDAVEEKTETKPVFALKVGFDWWVTEDWTFWVAYHGRKLIADEDEYGDLTDWQSDIEFGIATFITK